MKAYHIMKINRLNVYIFNFRFYCVRNYGKSGGYGYSERDDINYDEKNI